MMTPMQTPKQTHPKQIMRVLLLLFLLTTDVALAQEKGNDASMNLRGVVLPVRQSKLSFTQPGVVIELPLEGTQIKKGTLLARINEATARQQLAKAKASLAGAQLKLKQAVHAQEKNERLHKEQILSDMALEEGKFAITQGKIGMEQAESELASARLSMDGTQLFAPFDGVVSRVNAHLGEWIGAGSPALELVDLSQLEVSMDAPPDSLLGLEPGMETDVFINGQPGGTARVRTILPLVDAASGLRRVIWSVTPKPEVIMTGRYITLGGWGVNNKGGQP